MALVAVVFFLSGMTLDLLWVLCVQATASRNPALAALASFGLAILNLTLTVAIFAWPEARSVLCIGAFALGSAAGSYGLVRFNRGIPMARGIVTLEDVDAAYTKAACAIIFDDELPEIEVPAGTARVDGRTFTVSVRVVREKASRKAKAGPPRARKGKVAAR